MTSLKAINFKAFEPVSEAYSISAAVIVPAGLRTVATSGHVGTDLQGKLGETLQEQMRFAFEVCEVLLKISLACGQHQINVDPGCRTSKDRFWLLVRNFQQEKLGRRYTRSLLTTQAVLVKRR